MQPVDNNPSGAMQYVLDKRAANREKVSFSPWKKVPNVKDFKVEVSGLDALFLKFGIVKREFQPKVVFQKYKNRDINRFVEHQIIRMNKASDKTYWVMASSLMKRSNVFFMLALSHVKPRGHREYSFHVVSKWRRSYFRIARQDIGLMDIDFKRVYISKGEGKFRPLGVPKMEGRLYLHALNQFLVKRLDCKISDEQHGFRPHRGTLTAGLDVIKNVKDAKWVYEYDYKQFFPSLEITKITDVLARFEVPKLIREVIENLNKSQPKLTKSDKVDEFKAHQYEYISYCINNQVAPYGIYWEPIRANIIDCFGTDDPYKSPLLAECMTDNLGPGWVRNPQFGVLKFIEMQGALLASFGAGGTFYTMLQGVPQGAPTSPFLSALLEDQVVRHPVKKVKYADDGIAYSSDEFTLNETEEMRQAGIEYNLEKSAWVKRDGEGIRPLKFLGLIGDGKELRASTRKGSKLIYDKASLLEAVQEGYIRNPYLSKKGDSWEQFIRSEYAGFVMARLYNGSGNQKELWQSFELKYRDGSWVGAYFRGMKAKGIQPVTGFQMTVFNSTSLATRSVLEAFRLQDGKAIRKVTERGVRPDAEFLSKEEYVDILTKSGMEDSESNSKKSAKGDRYNQRKGMVAYCSNLVYYQMFIQAEIDRMIAYSKYSRQEMGDHYMNKYYGRKIKQVENILARGERLLSNGWLAHP